MASFIIDELLNRAVVTNFRFAFVDRLFSTRNTIIEKHYDLTIQDVMGDIHLKSDDILTSDQTSRLINLNDKIIDMLNKKEKYNNLYSICEYCGKTFLDNLDGEGFLCNKCQEMFNRDKSSINKKVELKYYDLRNKI